MTLEQVIDSLLYPSLVCPYCEREVENLDDDQAQEIADGVKEYIKEKYGLEVE